ncbi:SMP-30/gluconolactonase/LRE family protein [Winogradskya humida]|uniref:SMP-30/gluconolactonase/LRE family protein n=1 Tax=Winogradskya humida TaxID=113566 RepID=UPI0031DA5405
MATREAYILGEGPVWDSRRGRLLWVDIVGRAVLAGVFDGDRLIVEDRIAWETMVGAVTVAADGSLLVAAETGLVLLHPDGTRRTGPTIIPAPEPPRSPAPEPPRSPAPEPPRSPAPEPPRSPAPEPPRSPAPEPPRVVAKRRLNDGKTDPEGRFLVGTLAFAGDSQREVLVRLENDGAITTIDDDLTLSNGLAWSTDGSRLFSVDTLRRTVSVRDYATLGPRGTFITLDEGYPDGIAMDADDHLWMAVWGAGEVRRYDPAGTCVERIAVPAPHTSSVAFADDDLRRLVITTATDDLTDEQRQQFPDSGRIFTVRVDVPGHLVPAWHQPQEFRPCT